jgi:hypothetical protein
MRTSIAVVATAAFILFAQTANAKLADKRSFFHPLGFWSNEGFVKQKKVYHPSWKFDAIPVRYPDPGYEWGGRGGGLMHERGW